jgi:adenylyltransferase/sulfurtransferase
VGVVASWQALLAMKWIVRGGLPKSPSEQTPSSQLTVFELWSGEIRNVTLNRLSTCPTCVERRFDFLDGVDASDAKVLCGRNAVQIHVPLGRTVDLPVLARRLRELGQVVETPFLVRFTKETFTVTVFADGRGIVHGTENPEEARKIYVRWIGG